MNIENNEKETETKAEIVTLEGDFKKFFDDTFSSYDDEYTIKIYRVNKRGNKTFKTYLRKYESVAPDEDDIGNEFGGGHYWAVSNDLEKTISKHIWIDEIFTQKIEENKRITARDYPREVRDPVVQVDPMAQIAAFMKVLEPILKMTQGNNQQNNNNNQPAGVVTMMEGMADAFTKGMTKIQGVMINKKIENMESPAATPPIEEEKFNIAQEVCGMLREFGGFFLDSKGVKESLLKKTIENDKNFKQIKDDPDVIDAIYTMAVEDPEIGKDKIDKIFKKLGFPEAE